jgi:acetyl esterase/lipase
MRQRLILLAACLCVQTALAQQAGFPYPPQMPGAQVEVYKSAGNARLNIYIFNPPGHQAGDKHPSIVFFFGGGWRSGNPRQFEQQCRYLSSRGMVAMTADYRVASRHNVKVIDCVRDAKSAIRWVRRNASRLGVDPSRIAAGGGSAGGHLAAAAGVIPGLDEPGEDLKISSRPDALILFNPALVLASVTGLPPRVIPAEVQERFGTEPQTVSPYHHLAKGAPPAIIFHGKADTTVPYATVELFAKKSTALGNRCELVGFEGERHGFFNYGRAGGQRYRETLIKADEFLASLGYLEGQPRVP